MTSGLLLVTALQFAATATVLIAIWAGWMSHFSPEKVTAVTSQMRRDARTGRKPSRIAQGVFWCITLGFAVLIAGGVDYSLSWLPAGFGHDGEDGYISYRSAIAIAAGFFGTVPVTTMVLEYARLKESQNSAT